MHFMHKGQRLQTESSRDWKVSRKMPFKGEAQPVYGSPPHIIFFLFTMFTLSLIFGVILPVCKPSALKGTQP